MNKITTAFAATLLLAMAGGFAADSDDAVEVRRVLVLDKAMKPGAAAAQPKFEYIRLKTSDGKTNPELMCDACCKKAGFKDYVSKPAQNALTVAFMCASCGELCYREGGKEMKFTKEEDIKALKKIEEALHSPVDKTQKPTIQTLQAQGR